MATIAIVHVHTLNSRAINRSTEEFLLDHVIMLCNILKGMLPEKISVTKTLCVTIVTSSDSLGHTLLIYLLSWVIVNDVLVATP